MDKIWLASYPANVPAENFAHTLQTVIGRTRVRHVLVTGAADLLPAPMRLAAAAAMRLKRMVPAYSLPASRRLRVVLQEAFVKVLRRHRFVSLPAVNTLFNNLLAEHGFERVDFSSLRVAIGGGAAIQSGVARRWQALTGTPLCEGYGLTECSPTVAVNPPDLREFNGSIGLPLPSTEVSLRDAAGREVRVGELGELCVRRPQVMKGHWRRPGETAAVMTADGDVRTGDIATIDERGFLRIVDRLKDMILVSGFNVYPNEIEDVVASHAGVPRRRPSGGRTAQAARRCTCASCAATRRSRRRTCWSIAAATSPATRCRATCTS
jgi:acyl-CoA synthetase (AMP-forming)/AMP-acid ligase II